MIHWIIAALVGNNQSIAYHYTSPLGLLGILTSQCLWATDARFLNDPSEILYSEEILKEALQSFQSYKDYSMVCEKLDIGKINEIRSHIFLLSFSKNKDALSMWTYYGNNGYAIEVDCDLLAESKLLRIDNNINLKKRSSLGQVIYNRNSQIEETKKYLEKVFAVSEEEQNKAISHFIIEYATKSIFYKNQVYESENEVRLAIILSTEECKNQCYFRVSDKGVIIPYVKIDIKENMSIIKTITLHPAMDSKISIEGLRTLLYSYPEISNIPILKSMVPFRAI